MNENGELFADFCAVNSLVTKLKRIGKTWGEANNIAKDRRRWKATVVALCPLWDAVDELKF
jgi:hypothetical protein